MRIQKRVLLTFFGWLIPCTFIGLVALYFFLVGSFKNYIGLTFQRASLQAANQVTYRIVREVEKVKVLVQFPEILSVVESANLSYDDLNGDTSAYFGERDLAWQKAGRDDPLVVKYRVNPAAMKLREFQNYGWLRYNDILVTDKWGGLVAATGKPRDFYQGNEVWWQKAFANGHGNIYIGGIRYDEDVRIPTLILALPIWDWKHERVLGVVKLGLNARELLSFVYDNSFGRTGSTILVDESGNVLAAEDLAVSGSVPRFAKLADSSPSSWAILPWLDEKETILGYAPLDFSEKLVEDYSIVRRWFVVTCQELGEALQPIYFFYGQMCLFAGLFAVVIGLIDFYVARKITGPIQALNREAELVGQGNFSQRIDIRTGDEIESLGKAFNLMVERLKESYGELERKVKERTEELEERTKALEKMNQFMLGREERMITLKKEIEYLRNEVQKLKTGKEGK